MHALLLQGVALGKEELERVDADEARCHVSIEAVPAVPWLPSTAHLTVGKRCLHGVRPEAGSAWGVRLGRFCTKERARPHPDVLLERCQPLVFAPPCGQSGSASTSSAST